MDTEKKPANDVQAYINQIADANPVASVPASVAHLFPANAGTTTSESERAASPLDKQPQDSAIAKVAVAAPAPATTPSADLEQPAALELDELATTAGKRPLAHFGQVLPVTKSKANRKLVLQLTPEMYQYFAHVSTLSALDGVALPDLALAILQAWREDYRPDIKRANAAFKA